MRGERGGVVRNLATTHLLDRLAAQLGEKCYEVPVGFKHIAAAMVEHNALLGGESSGGLTIRGHILGKDGIFASALVVEMLARTGQKISQLLERVYAITGRLYDLEESLPATPEMRIVVPRRLKEAPCGHIGPYPVIGVSHMDGTKLLLENDNWALLRFSGTEPVLRLVGGGGYAGEGAGTDRLAAAVCDGVRCRLAPLSRNAAGPSREAVCAGRDELATR